MVSGVHSVQFRNYASTLSEALVWQGRVVSALILREMLTRYGRSGLGYLWALLEPLMMVGVFYAAFLALGRQSHAGMELIPFLSTGIVTFMAIRGTVRSLANAIESNRGLLTYPHVSPLDTLIARAILETVTFVVVFSIIVGGAYLLDQAPIPHDLFGVLIAVFAAMALAFSWGGLEWALTMIWPAFEKLTRPLWRLMLWTSCVFYTLNDMPSTARVFLEYNPIVHAIELLRSAFFIGYATPINSYTYLIVWIMSVLFLALLLERSLRDRVKQS